MRPQNCFCVSGCFVQPWTDAKLLNLLAWQAREDCVNLPGTVDEYKEADDLENPGLTSSVGHLDSNLDKVLTLTIIDPSLDLMVIVGSILTSALAKHFFFRGHQPGASERPSAQGWLL